MVSPPSDFIVSVNDVPMAFPADTPYSDVVIVARRHAMGADGLVHGDTVIQRRVGNAFDTIATVDADGTVTEVTS